MHKHNTSRDKHRDTEHIYLFNIYFIYIFGNFHPAGEKKKKKAMTKQNIQR